MRQAQAVDGFRLAYERTGEGPPVILLHGWPGDRTDYQGVVPLVSGSADLIVPDLRGFGQSDKHPVDPGTHYSAAAQAIARAEPGLVRGLVLSPPFPGIGDRILSPAAQREFWYQPYHQLALSSDLIDGRPELVRAYLRHFWSHWSGPDFESADGRVDRLVSGYAQPGAFASSIAWYRAGAGSVAVSVAERPPGHADRLAVPTAVLWPSHDPLFPIDWSDRIDDYFGDARLTRLDRSGHFTPVERPREFAAAVEAAVTWR